MNKKCRDNSVEFRDKKDNESAVADLLKKGERPKTLRSERSKPLCKHKGLLACLLACLLAEVMSENKDTANSPVENTGTLLFAVVTNLIV